MKSNQQLIMLLITMVCLLCLLTACGPGLGFGGAEPDISSQDIGPIGEADIDPIDDEEPVIMEAPDLVAFLLQCRGDYTVPDLVYPINGEVIGWEAPMTFEWQDHCFGLIYDIEIIHFPEGADAFLQTEDTTTEDAFYLHVLDLEPMTSYLWRVIVTPYDGDAKASNWSIFTTGPVCDPTELVSPIMVSPADGATDDGKDWGDMTEVELVIEYPTPPVCAPEGFTIQVYDNPDFTGQSYNIAAPSFFTSDANGARLVKDDSNSLFDCTTYFVRSWASSAQTDGPHSAITSFYTDFESSCLRNIRFQAHIDANCRSNPWIANNEVGIMWEGDSAKMLGRNEDGWWGKFLLDNGLMCWVHMGSLDPLPLGLYFDPLWMEALAHDPKPEPASEGSEGDDQPSQPVTACLVPDYSNPKLVSWNCVSPCPDPKFASRTCKP